MSILSEFVYFQWFFCALSNDFFVCSLPPRFFLLLIPFSYHNARAPCNRPGQPRNNWERTSEQKMVYRVLSNFEQIAYRLWELTKCARSIDIHRAHTQYAKNKKQKSKLIGLLHMSGHNSPTGSFSQKKRRPTIALISHARAVFKSLGGFFVAAHISLGHTMMLPSAGKSTN